MCMDTSGCLQPTIKHLPLRVTTVKHVQDLCWECRESFLFQQQRDLREYTQATVYVRKVIEDKITAKDGAPELNACSSEAEEEKEELPKVDGEKDPDFSQSQDGAKRIKLNDSSAASVAASSVTSMIKPGGIRRSTRHRKLRGEKALIVSANQTLKELKIQIMHAFSVAPFDQNLSIDGRSLTDDSATLGSLGVIPECIICLKADEPVTDYAAIDDAYQGEQRTLMKTSDWRGDLKISHIPL
ncbi:Ubiquitin carboxyl-terminal hydrolase 48 [Ameca splendens]|uniref:Ubiquitin carboxyl-terminal hydrolase 48 n=1 Tax=Ameca splendens TaxID=208324 RepID=A0ABV0YR13_9TELE